MNCAEFQTIVHELAREDASETLSESTAVMARLHAQICDACAASLMEARTLTQALSEVAEESGSWKAPAGIEVRLASEFREHHQNRERARYRERRARLRWAEWIGVGAAAAALLTIGAWNFSHERVVKTGNSTAAVTSAVNSNGGAAQNISDESVTAGATGEFVPLPYGENFSEGDSGMVVRVEMTRGTLETLGYPVDEANANEVIQADLLVGEDGLPRAVRLVQ